MIVPLSLEETGEKVPELRAWLERLPALVEELAARWGLEVGECLGGEEASCGWVAAVTCADGASAVLKLGMPHWEGEQEIAGLRFWDGDDMARLLEADEGRGAMLLERCVPGTHLRARPEPQQDEVIAGLLRRLWRIPSGPAGFRPLSALMAHWSEETRQYEPRWRDPGLVRAGLALFDSLPGSAPSSALLATDLHAGNVLRAEREPWLAIDPKPFVGDPAYDATQHLFNCLGRMDEDPFGTIARLAGLLGVEAERVRLWTFARAAAEPREGWARCRRFDLARRLRP